ncbi:hypothetical protein HMPREF1492_0146 [Atopobium sp. BS2]|nr:hypothetical protein HMPREF1492_0146 [Atopobium sp. BS2]
MHENEKFKIRDGLVCNRQGYLYVGVPFVVFARDEIDL